MNFSKSLKVETRVLVSKKSSIYASKYLDLVEQKGGKIRKMHHHDL